MSRTLKSNGVDRSEPERAERCLHLAVRAHEHAAQTSDPEMRTSFLNMKELWLDLAKVIDRRQDPSGMA